MSPSKMKATKIQYHDPYLIQQKSSTRTFKQSNPYQSNWIKKETLQQSQGCTEAAHKRVKQSRQAMTSI